MFILNQLSGFNVGGGGLPYPYQSLNLVRASSQSLTMTNTNFGSRSRNTFAISGYIKLASLGNNQPIISQDNGSNQLSFIVSIDSSNRLDFGVSNNGANTSFGRLVTNTTCSVNVWYQFMIHYDGNNATAGNRMRMWLNGDEQTSFATDTNPNGDVFNSTGPYNIGGLGDFFDGKIAALTVYDNSLPSIAEVYYTDPRVVTGAKSLLDVAGGDVTSDYFLATNWTNNNGVTASMDMPI